MKIPINQYFLNSAKWLITLFGYVVYFYLIYSSYLGLRDTNIDTHSILNKTQEFILYVIYVSGLPPMLVLTYFVTLAKTIKKLSIGLVVLIVSIFLHAYVSMAIAHATPVIYFLMIFVEIILVFGAIYWWRRQDENRKI